MLNSKPNKRNKYKQGLFIPQNKSKVIKLNDQGGFYYRSGLELKLMIYFDTNPNILIWNPEIIKIPYLQNTFDNKKQAMVKEEHLYWPDFYYELQNYQGEVIKYVAEAKPYKQTQQPKLIENPDRKQRVKLDFEMKEYSKNMDKWKFCMAWCKEQGINFQIITEKTFEKKKK